ncbi:MAG: hypothetical protein EHM36_09240, partial [Deltaproteobacteria bacterium]
MRAFSLKTKFTIVALSIGLVGFGIPAFLANQWMAGAFEKHYKEEALLVRTHIAHDLETAMLSKEHEKISKVLDIYRTYKAVKELRLFDLNGKEVFAKEKGPPEERLKETISSGAITSFDKEIDGTPVTSYVIPIPNKSQCHGCHGKHDKLRGGLLISFSLEEMKQGIAEQRLRFTVLFGILAVIISAATLFAVSDFFIKPLSRMQKGAEAIGKG